MTAHRIISFLLVSVFTASSAFAQSELFFPIKKDQSKEKSLLEEIRNRYSADLARLDGQHKKSIAGIYKERYEMILEHFNGNEIITDKKVSAYLNSVTSQVIRSNPSLDLSGVRVLFSRAWWPNASSMGEGTILFNIGLFHRLDNESEMVFTLCHELAHYYLNHGNNRIRKYVEQVNSQEFQKELKNIQKSEYRQNQQVEALVKNLSFSNMRHSRDFEEAADSMALELMKNTGYDLKGALTCLAKLDSSDLDKFNKPLQLESVFQFEAFPFKKRWIEAETLMFASSATEKDKAEEDSLKTHPDCEKRIEKLSPSVERYNKNGNRNFIVDELLFRQLKSGFDFEVLEYCFERKKISKCLYYTLKMLQDYPDNAYLYTMAGKCLNELYKSQKAHELGRIVDLPSPAFKEEYNKLLHLIQNVRLYEIASIAYYFLHQQKGRFEGNKSFAAVWETSVENFNKQ